MIARRSLSSVPSFVLALLLVTGCGQSFRATRPTEPVRAAGAGVSAALERVFVTDGLRADGLNDEARLVVEVRVKNEGPVARQISPGSFSFAMELDEKRPDQTRALLAAGGGEGPFPGSLPDEGSVLAGVTVQPGEERIVWAIFEAYRFEGSGQPRKVTVTIPLEGRAPLALVIADPARGGLRWESRAPRGAFVIGLRSGSLMGGSLKGMATSNELTWMWHAGPLRLDAGILSTVFIQTRGPLVSETSAFTGTGLTAHVSAPVLTWGPEQSLRQVSLYGGGSASFLIELPKRTPDEKDPLHSVGLYHAEAGVEIAAGMLHLAATPFPLSERGRQLPRWAIRAGYVQSWAGGVTSGGYATTLRFVW
jgi:hypothetical protein